MARKPQPRCIRIIVFDDEPAQLLEAARAIQTELLSEQRIQIQIQAYRMDWLYHAQQEIEEHRSQIAMIWLIDLHQMYALDERVRAQATGLIDDLGDEARKAVEELYRTAAEKLGKDQQIVPDGVALIAKARERNIPFFVSSKYLESEYILPLLRKLAIGDNDAAADYWEVRKVAGEIEVKSRDRLRARILELARPLPPELSTLFAQGTKWHSRTTLSNIIMVVALLVAAYLGYEQLFVSQRSVDLSTNQPEYLIEKLIFTSSGEELVWDLLDKDKPLSALPKPGQVARFEIETKKSEDHLLAVWYSLSPQKRFGFGPKMARLEGRYDYPLETGTYFVFFLLSNDKLGNEKPLLTEEFQKLLSPLSTEMKDGSGAWICEKGNVKYSKTEGPDKKYLLEGLCQEVFQQFEASNIRNRKISMITFSIK